ncbi:MAG: aldehyde dehydrogenase [Flaviaesturariibacter sp.]|nr:aldehyde dehydrogenase [Flaviaesturariibacter sp.]
MDKDDTIRALSAQRRFFQSGATLPFAFRRDALDRLRAAVLQQEQALYGALYADLKKSKEEAWVTEIGFLLAEIGALKKGLRKWMKPERVRTNLLNFPSRSYIYREPLGVAMVIGPWNYPLQLLLAPLAGALAAGNCVVLKPSEFAPETAAVMKTIIAAAFPPEHVLYVEGEGNHVIPPMMDAFRFDHVFYTGSTHVGRIIYELAAQKLTPVTLELGGKSPCVVESDANLKVAARRIAMPKFSNAGQMCVAPDYILVHRSVRDKLVVHLSESIQSFFTDDASASANYGRIINGKNFHRLTALMEQGTVLVGGRSDEASHYIEPTLLADVPLDKAVMGEEIFGPLLPIIPFDTYEEAKEIIARNPNPLAFYVFTEDRRKEERWLRELPFGGGCVNNASWHLTNPNLPFGGRGASGMGAYHGRFSFDVFSHRKAVMKTPTWFDPSIKYPPFSGKLGLFKKMIR